MRLQREVFELTKELCEDPCEEGQIAGNIVCHGRRKRFHNGINAKHLLKELHNHHRATSVPEYAMY